MWSFLWWTIKLEFKAIQWLWMLWFKHRHRKSQLDIYPTSRTAEWVVMMCQLLNDMFCICVCVCVCVHVCVGLVLFYEAWTNNQRTASMLAACEFFFASFVLQTICVWFFILSSLHSLTQLNLNPNTWINCMFDLMVMATLFSCRMTHHKKNSWM